MDISGITPGMRVLIVSDHTRADEGGSRWNDAGRMDKWLGKVMTVREAYDNFLKMEEDQSDRVGGWSWFPEMIADIWTDSEFEGRPEEDIMALLMGESV